MFRVHFLILLLSLSLPALSAPLAEDGIKEINGAKLLGAANRS
jgi:hypothetical protein